MTEHATLDHYTTHSALTDPGPYAALVESLPSDVPALCGTLQGLLIHEAWIGKHGLDLQNFLGQSRETLPVARRLEQILAIDALPLGVARPSASRALSTCRDFALMLCCVLRQHGVPARVRCGYGRYFASNPYQDHWVCEYWAAAERRWVMVDAELDEMHRDHLAFDFDPTDMPRTAFTTGIEAWKLCRDGTIDPRQLGHGRVTGLFFARLNLVRDLLALARIETSAWDSWRAAREEDHVLDDATLSFCDRIASGGEGGAAELAPSLRTPPWLQPAR